MQETRTTRAATKLRSERTFRSGPYLDAIFGGNRVDAELQRQICQRIKKARIEAGYSQEDIAALLNVTTRAWQNYESVRVPFRRMGDIAKVTKRTEVWLLHGDPEERVTVETFATLLARVEGLESTLEDVRSMLRELVQGQAGSAEE